MSRSAEEEQDARSRHTADWKVDVKAPAPGDGVSKHASKKWANYTGNAEDGTNAANNGRYFLWRCDKRGDCVASQVCSSSTSALDSTSNDKCRAIRCQSTDEAADFEDSYGGEETTTYGKVVVAFAPDRLEGCQGEEEC